jgi:hypothetical protein
VHDGIEIEKRGIPAAVICTDQFEKTGKAISEMRGMAGFPFVTVPHPVGSLSQDEVAGRAEIAFAAAVKLLMNDK